MDAQHFAYEVTRCFVQDFAAVLGSEVVGRIQGWIRSRNLKGLTQCSSLLQDPAKQGPEFLRCLMQIEAFFKKNAAFSSASCEQAALTSFLEAEKVCRITNRRLDHYHTHPDRLDPDMRGQIARMQRIIATTLGPFEAFLPQIPELVKVTSGATFRYSRRESQPYRKFRKTVDCAPRAASYLKALYRYYGYEPPVLNACTSNRVETVPKNWKTHRTIGCEPDGNTPLQLAFDTFAKRRMKRHLGVNLHSQFRNQRMARESSISGSHATVDIKQASDTEAYNAVAWLFPCAWFQYLSDIRSSTFILNGETVRYAKFSSMGNGTTFCTETLIFASACKAVGSQDYAVYGDDIVIESELLPSLLRLLSFFGFTINTAKSYWTGPFRESCGVNCYQGIDITPFYLRDKKLGNAKLSHAINGLASISLPEGKLWHFLRDCAVGLPMVPLSEQTTSGIFIDTPSAYSLKKLRSNRNGTLVTKQYVLETEDEVRRDIRNLILWHFNARVKDQNNDLRQSFGVPLDAHCLTAVAHGTVNDTGVTSSVPTLRSKYVRKWVGWIPPAQVAPVHLFWWTEFVLAGPRAPDDEKQRA